MSNQFEQEEESLQKQYESCQITLAEYRKELRELQRDYRAAADDAIREAGERERDRWYDRGW